MSELLEKMLSDENIRQAQKRVYANKGAGGVDGVTVQELAEYMQENWTRIKGEIRERKYKPPAGTKGGNPEGKWRGA